MYAVAKPDNSLRDIRNKLQELEKRREEEIKRLKKIKSDIDILNSRISGSIVSGNSPNTPRVSYSSVKSENRVKSRLEQTGTDSKSLSNIDAISLRLEAERLRRKIKSLLPEDDLELIEGLDILIEKMKNQIGFLNR